MLVKEVAKRLSISHSYVRLLFVEWCKANDQDPHQYLTVVVVPTRDETEQPVVAYDIPTEAFEWIKARIERNRGIERKKYTPYKKRKEVKA